MEENVKVTVGNGSDCFICEQPTVKGNPVLTITVKLPAFIATITVNKDMHLECAANLRDLINLRLEQAGGRAV